MHPILLQFGPLALHSYGVMLMLAFLAGLLLSRGQARRRGLDPDLPLDLGVWILIASVIFARGLYLALSWHEQPLPLSEAVAVWRSGGLSFFGGLLGGVLAALAFAWRARLSFWTLADVMSPGLALGYAIARIGCFLNGCCYGTPTHGLHWGVTFPGLTPEPVYPTQLYSSAGSLLIMAALLWLQPRLKSSGQLFAAYLLLYSVLRGVVEIFRLAPGAVSDTGTTGTAERLVPSLPISQAQLACALLLIAAAALFIHLSRRDAKAAPLPTPHEAT